MSKRQVTDYPYIEFTVRAYNTSPRHFPDSAKDVKEGLALFLAFPSEVTDDDGSDLGSIAGGTGAVVIQDNVREAYWQIPHDQLWYAYIEAVKKQDTI